jgi:catechol 2,3-dioxygenase-like lactoylglutathione lyase family enzyme
MVETETEAKLESISPFFIVSNLDQTVAFYTEKLGFETRFIGPIPDPYIAVIGRQGIEMLVKEITEEVKPIPNSSRHGWTPWDAFVYTSDPEVLAADFTERGCEFKEQLTTTPDNLYGFKVRDPNGYVIFFGKVVYD